MVQLVSSFTINSSVVVTWLSQSSTGVTMSFTYRDLITKEVLYQVRGGCGSEEWPV